MLITTTELSNSNYGVAVSTEQQELKDLLECYDEIPVLAGMYQVDWSHYIKCIEGKKDVT